MRIHRHRRTQLLATSVVFGSLFPGCLDDAPTPCPEDAPAQGSPCGQVDGVTCVSAGVACDERQMECRDGRYEVVGCLGPQASECAQWERCGEGGHYGRGEYIVPALLRSGTMEAPLTVETDASELTFEGAVE